MLSVIFVVHAYHYPAKAAKLWHAASIRSVHYYPFQYSECDEAGCRTEGKHRPASSGKRPRMSLQLNPPISGARVLASRMPGVG
jgi:hypothetical protein